MWWRKKKAIDYSDDFRRMTDVVVAADELMIVMQKLTQKKLAWIGVKDDVVAAHIAVKLEALDDALDAFKKGAP